MFKGFKLSSGWRLFYVIFFAISLMVSLLLGKVLTGEQDPYNLCMISAGISGVYCALFVIGGKAAEDVVKTGFLMAILWAALALSSVFWAENESTPQFFLAFLTQSTALFLPILVDYNWL